MTENEIAREVADLCFKIHTPYGPGLFESVYEEIFCYEWPKKAWLMVKDGIHRIVNKL